MASTEATTLGADELRRYPTAAGPSLPLWPYDGSCDASRLRDKGWKPTPLTEFIFKVESRCNLNCSYCYVYNLADQSWRDQPVMMSPEIVRQAGSRIAEHTAAHDLAGVRVSLHGGEPLLHGVDFPRHVVQTLRTMLWGLDVRVSMQTNGTLVTPQIAAELGDLGIGVGVSIDGPPEANDRFRRTIAGTSTINRTVAGIAALHEVGVAPDGPLAGLLSVVDVRNRPLETYEFLASLGAPSIDFLLPHGNHDEPPAYVPAAPPEAGPEGREATPYADWLIRIFDHWIEEPAPRVRIRLFDDIINLVLGGRHAFEGLGLEPSTLVVIEASGQIELVDHLKSTYDGAVQTGHSVATSTLDEVLEHPGVVCGQLGLDALHETCRSCDVVSICGGGLLSHRWSRVFGLRTPTVYCADMYRLVTHIERVVWARLSAVGATA